MMSITASRASRQMSGIAARESTPKPTGANPPSGDSLRSMVILTSVVHHPFDFVVKGSYCHQLAEELPPLARKLVEIFLPQLSVGNLVAEVFADQHLGLPA